MDPSSPDKYGSINLSGCGIMPRTFLFSLSIPAILFDEPLGLDASSISPLELQYLKAIKSFSSSSLRRSFFAR